MSAVTPLTPMQRTVLRMIEAAADAGRICPSNGEIADRCGFLSCATSVRVMDALRDGGWITLRRFQAGREVTVCATGRSTHWPHARTPHWRERVTPQPARSRKPVSAPVRAREDAGSRSAVRQPPIEGLVRLDRDPCFRCGVRADLGCEHQPASVAEEMVA